MSNFCEQLRFWRKAKNFSQLDLALETEVSSKHISFLETGRSKPSELMVLRLCEALGLPLRSRNELLSMAGFAEHYARTPLEQDAMQQVRKTLDIILKQQEPYPATVLDWDWNIIMHNDGFSGLMAFIKAAKPEFSTSVNVAELIFSEDGFKPFLSNWEEIAAITFRRLRREQQVNPGRHEALLQKLYDDPAIPRHVFDVKGSDVDAPFVYVDCVLGDLELKFLTTVTSFGTPIDMTAEEVMIENYYPADEATRRFFEAGLV